MIGFLACVIIGSLLSFMAHAAPVSSAVSKNEGLKFLENLRSVNCKRRTDVDASIAKSIEFGDDNMVDEIATLKRNQLEYQMRQEFLDRLINQITAHYGGGDWRTFLAPALKEMAKVDAIESTGGLFVFLRNASEALQRSSEPREDALALLENYMNQSVAHPVPIKEFLSGRNYTNGARSASGHPMDRENVGLVVEERLKASSVDTTSPPIR